MSDLGDSMAETVGCSALAELWLALSERRNPHHQERWQR
jgi:hypothetical protein